MRKYFLLFLIMLLTSECVFAYNYSAADKKEFYDNFLSSMFVNMNNSLVSQGFTKESSNQLTNILKTRVDRTQLENETWGCITKYEPDYLMQNIQNISAECFGTWSSNLVNDNKDLTQLLKK